MPHGSSDQKKPYFDEELHAAYLTTKYTCGRYALKIGRSHPDFDDFLVREDFSTYVFITAWNPRSKALSEAENLARGQKLQLRLKELGLVFMPAAAHDPSEKWAVEKGVFIFNAGTEVVLKLATIWEQNAVVIGVRGGIPELRWA
ncbi:MAG: DUF3293 domain-containing protein [Lewinella sp.]|nr:DUF3293 domain-containing protein [Lewinella sp.]